MTHRSRVLVLLISAPVLVFAVLGGYLGRTFAQEDAYRHLRIFEDTVSLILNNYVEQVEVDDVMRGALRGLSAGFDGEISYLTPDEVQTIEQDDPLPAGTTGLTLTRQYYLRVVAARDGSPAARAGLRPGDYVRGIDGQSTRDVSVLTGAWLLRGDPGTTVSLTVIRGNAAEPHIVELTRERVESAAVSSRIVSERVGYVRIAAFTDDAPAQVASHVGALVEAGAERLAIDVRETAEGRLPTGLAVAQLFVGSGTLGIRAPRGGEQETTVADAGGDRFELPTVVLINYGTAAAAELFASALAVNDRGELVGVPSLGQTAEQRLVKLPDGSGLWLSWSQYLTASGEPLHRQGLEPTLAAEEPFLEFGTEQPVGDPVLDKALEHLAGLPAA